MNQQFEQQLLSSWQERQEFAERMQPLLGKLYRDHAVEVSVYGRPLLGVTSIDIIKAHRAVRLFESHKLRLRESWPLLEALSEMKLAPGRVDLGKLAFQYHHSDHGHDSIDAFLRDKLVDLVDVEDTTESQDVVLYGFGTYRSSNGALTY